MRASSSVLPTCRQSDTPFAPSTMKLYDEHFNLLDTPVPSFPGRLGVLQYNPSSDGNASIVVFGGNTETDPTTGGPCLDSFCFAVLFFSADYNTPAGFNSIESSAVYTAKVSSRVPTSTVLGLV